MLIFTQSAHSFVTPNKNSENTQMSLRGTLITRKLMKSSFLPMMTIRRFLSSSPTPSMVVFDRETKRKQRDHTNRNRDAERTSFDYLRDYVATQLTDRLMDITREFPVAVNLGVMECMLRSIWIRWEVWRN